MRCLFPPLLTQISPITRSMAYATIVAAAVLQPASPLPRCVGGALAKLALRQLGISITAYTSQVGSIALEKDYHLYDLNTIEDNPVRCPDQQKAKEMEDLIAQVKADGDTIGGIITCVIKGCPVGLGEPEFTAHAQLGAAMLGINAVKGFEYGRGICRSYCPRK